MRSAVSEVALATKEMMVGVKRQSVTRELPRRVARERARASWRQPATCFYLSRPPGRTQSDE